MRVVELVEGRRPADERAGCPGPCLDGCGGPVDDTTTRPPASQSCGPSPLFFLPCIRCAAVLSSLPPSLTLSPPPQPSRCPTPPLHPSAETRALDLHPPRPSIHSVLALPSSVAHHVGPLNRHLRAQLRLVSYLPSPSLQPACFLFPLPPLVPPSSPLVSPSNPDRTPAC